MKKPPKGRQKSSIRTSAQRQVIMVLSEGTITERRYLHRMAESNRSVTLKFGKSGKSPDKLVVEAQKMRSHSMWAGKFDQLWCIFDVDHLGLQRINEICNNADRDNVKTVVSNPCFELWLVLHKERQNGQVTSDAIQRRAEDLRLIDGKEIAAAGWSCLFGNYEDAKARAKALDEMHRQIGSPSGSNPSSDVWKLIDVLRS